MEDFSDPVSQEPLRRPVVFHDCVLELYTATCLTATRLSQLGLPWPSTTEEVMVILHTTPSPLTRQYLGRGMTSVAVANMARAAAAAQQINIPATMPEELMLEVLGSDPRLATNAADAMAMDLVTGHVHVEHYERVLSAIIANSKERATFKLSTLFCMAQALLERAIEPEISGGSCPGGKKAVLDVFASLCETWLVVAQVAREYSEGELPAKWIKEFFVMLTRGMRSADGHGAIWKILFRRRRQFVELMQPPHFREIADIAMETESLVSKEEWLLVCLADKISKAPANRALEWGQAGSRLFLKLLRPDYMPANSFGEVLYNVVRGILDAGILGDARMPEILAAACKRTFFMDKMVADREEWLHILRHHCTAEVAPGVLACLVKASSRQKSLERVQGEILDAFKELRAV